jgi:hypothetical protein
MCTAMQTIIQKTISHAKNRRLFLALYNSLTEMFVLLRPISGVERVSLSPDEMPSSKRETVSGVLAHMYLVLND